MGNIYPDLQEKLKRIRAARGLTLPEVAAVSGIPLGTYNQAEINGVMGRKTRRRIEKWINKNRQYLKEEL